MGITIWAHTRWSWSKLDFWKKIIFLFLSRWRNSLQRKRNHKRPHHRGASTSVQINVTNEAPMKAIIAPFNEPTFPHTNNMILSPSLIKKFQDLLLKSWRLVYLFDTPSPSNPTIIKQGIPNGFLDLTTIPSHIVKDQIVMFNPNRPQNDAFKEKLNIFHMMKVPWYSISKSSMFPLHWRHKFKWLSPIHQLADNSLCVIPSLSCVSTLPKSMHDGFFFVSA